MLDPNDISDALVAKLKAIAAYVALMGGSANNISAYKDTAENNDVARAVRDLGYPGTLVVYEGSGPGSAGQRKVWRHNFRVYLKCAQSASGNAYSAIFRQFVDGVPAGGDNQPMQRTTIHASCYPMDTPSLDRHVIPVGSDYLEVFAISVSFTEKGA